MDVCYSSIPKRAERIGIQFGTQINYNLDKHKIPFIPILCYRGKNFDYHPSKS